MLTISNFRVESDLSSNERLNEEHDYVLLDVSVENISDHESNPYHFGPSKFTFYNQNGVEIEADYFSGIEKNTFDASLSTRPGSKMEGTMVIPITKGEKVSEIILNTSGNTKINNTFVFKINE